jgi:hypothetical protein
MAKRVVRHCEPVLSLKTVNQLIDLWEKSRKAQMNCTLLPAAASNGVTMGSDADSADQRFAFIFVGICNL